MKKEVQELIDAVKEYLPYIHSHNYPKKRFADRLRKAIREAEKALEADESTS